MRFARLDFEKFLGGNVVGEIIALLEIEERLAKAEATDLAATAMPGDTQSQQNIAPARSAQRQGGAGGFDPSDLESMPPQMRERIEQIAPGG